MAPPKGHVSRENGKQAAGAVRSKKEAKPLDAELPNEAITVTEPAKRAAPIENEFDNSAEFISFSSPSVKKVKTVETPVPVSKTDENSAVVIAYKEASQSSAKEMKTPWLRKPDEYSPVLIEMLQEEIEDFIKYIQPTPKERALREHIINEIAHVVSSLWPQAQTKTFGSFATDLYLPTSDIDVVIICESPVLTVDHLRSLARRLQSSGLVESMQVIDKARVPIIKIIDSMLGVRIDISFNMTNGLTAAEVIRKELVKWPVLKPLAFIIKQFLLQRSLNEVFTGGLSSYSILVLIVSFLQMHPRIQARIIDPMKNIAVLLIEFFELYGLYFNYETTAISIANGGAYFPKASRKWVNKDKPYLLSLEDPQDKDNDISVGSYNVPLIKKAFEHAFKSICSVVARNKNQRPTDPKSAPIPTLLGLIIALDARSTTFREVMSERYDKIQQAIDEGIDVFGANKPGSDDETTVNDVEE